MILYKYLPIERLDVLKIFQLRFSPISALNDPYEGLPFFTSLDSKYIEDIGERNKPKIPDSAKSAYEIARYIMAIEGTTLEVCKKFRENPSILTNKLLEKWRHRLNRALGFLCLSKRIDSTVMWAHYASNHKGFAIGFESDHNFFKQQPDDWDDIGNLQDVDYSPNRLEVSVEDIDVDPRIFLRKNSDWCYENETRLIRSLTKASKVVEDQDQKVHLFDIPKDSIHSVIVGLNSTDGFQLDVRRLLNQDIALRHVRLQKAELDERSFNLKIVDIDN